MACCFDSEEEKKRLNIMRVKSSPHLRFVGTTSMPVCCLFEYITLNTRIVFAAGNDILFLFKWLYWLPVVDD